MPLLLLLIVWVVAELAAAIAVAHLIGVLLTVILLIAGWPIGTWLIRAEGRTAMRHVTAAAATGRTPGREAVDGALRLLGGALFVIPGFLTDLLGLTLLIDPVRDRVRSLATRHVLSRLATVPGFRASQPGYDVDSTAHDLDQPQLHG